MVRAAAVLLALLCTACGGSIWEGTFKGPVEVVPGTCPGKAVYADVTLTITVYGSGRAARLEQDVCPGLTAEVDGRMAHIIEGVLCADATVTTPNKTMRGDLTFITDDSLEWRATVAFLAPPTCEAQLSARLTRQ